MLKVGLNFLIGYSLYESSLDGPVIQQTSVVLEPFLRVEVVN